MISQKELLTQIAQLVIESDVCPRWPKNKWAKIIMEAHIRGYLYVVVKDDILDSVVCAYRTPKILREKPMPDKEFGDCLYVDWAVSKSNDKLILRKMLTSYIDENTDIRKIYYYRRNNHEDFVIRDINRSPKNVR